MGMCRGKMYSKVCSSHEVSCTFVIDIKDKERVD